MTRVPPRITFVVNNRRASRVLQSRRRRRVPLRQRVSPAERKRRHEVSQQNTHELNEAIEDWYRLTLRTAAELGERFNHRPRWVLDKMFYRGAHVKKQNKTNAWNAWASKTCAELNAGTYAIPLPNSWDSRNTGREEGNLLSLMDIREKYGNEYAALTPAEKEKLVAEFESKKVDPAAPSTRVTAQSRVLDFANTYDQIANLVRSSTSAWFVANTNIIQMQALSTRIGAHGFFCLIRASPHYNTAPRWYFTDDEINEYLKFVIRRRWDPRLVGTQLEAFAIAGCDINSGCIYSMSILISFLTLRTRSIQDQGPEDKLPDYQDPRHVGR